MNTTRNSTSATRWILGLIIGSFLTSVGVSWTLYQDTKIELRQIRTDIRTILERLPD